MQLGIRGVSLDQRWVGRGGYLYVRLLRFEHWFLSLSIRMVTLGLWLIAGKRLVELI